MRKYLKYIVAVILVLISVFLAKASTGCNLGNQIFPNATGGVNATGYPTYHNTNPITIRWWEGDTNCGILDSKIQKRSNNQDKCEVIGNNWGVVYLYSDSNNSCTPTPPMGLPLDDYNWAIILGVGAVGGFVIARKGMM